MISELKLLSCSFIEEIRHCSLDENIDYCYLNGEVAHIPKVEEVEEVEQIQEDVTTYNEVFEEFQQFQQFNPIAINNDERYWLEKLVEAESSNEPYEGKVAVANVILNRVLDNEFPNTVDGVIKQPGQYSPWVDGSIYERTASNSTKIAVQEVFDQGRRVISEDTVYFVSTHSNENWINTTRTYVTTIGNHDFYSKY